METATIWFLILGIFMTMMGALHSNVRRLPLTTAIIYLPIGYLLGSNGFNLIHLDPLKNASLLERISEGVVIISLFTAGLKLRTPLSHQDWRPAFRLATVGMLLTVFGIAGFCYFIFDFSPGASILLGAILAPTDPVLASDVQVRGPADRDPLRFSLTAEAGFNDGTAFPFVLLGLAIMGLHNTGGNFLQWFAIDIVWKVIAGLSSGAVLGLGVAKAILALRARNKESSVLDDFLTIGLICLSYGFALAINAYGFLAVFAAGVALRRTERVHSSKAQPIVEKGLESEAPPAQMARAVLNFNEQLERLGEVATVVLLGALLNVSFFLSQDLWLVPAILFLIRPVSVLFSLCGLKIPPTQKGFICWFGIRGIGSIYYLSYAVAKGVPHEISSRIIAVVLATVTISILLHGVSVTPLMEFYQNQLSRLRRRATKN